jgi:hypothetical protein
MVNAAVCFEREFFIKDVPFDKVTSYCVEALKKMRLRIEKEESAGDGKTTIFASEGALVPLILKALLFPFSLGEYVKSAQRSGLHLLISPDKDGTHVYFCGLALDEVTGKLANYAKDEVIEEVTSTMEALDFENRFIKRIQKRFPKAKQIR